MTATGLSGTATHAPLQVRIEAIQTSRLRLDPGELSERVTRELEEMLVRVPLPVALPAGSVLRVPDGAVIASCEATAAGVAHAVARHIYRTLMTTAPAPTPTTARRR